MTTYAYYPGCSVKGTGKAGEESLLAVFGALGLGLDEIEDWNCCGATAYMSIDETQATALAARNLALAARAGGDLVTPCSACYLVLNKTRQQLEEQPAMRQRVNAALGAVGLEPDGATRVRHPLDVLVNDVGLDAIKARVTRPLRGLRVAPYYGCQIVRPYALFDSQHDPVTMDRLLAATGADVVKYRLKTRCCGGSQTGTMPEIGYHLLYRILKEAHDQEADVIATICPLCQFNLEAFQPKVAREHDVKPIPVVYFTQLIGWAFGLSEQDVGLHRALIPIDVVKSRRTADVS